jgi:hypothetical protein
MQVLARKRKRRLIQNRLCFGPRKVHLNLPFDNVLLMSPRLASMCDRHSTQMASVPHLSLVRIMHYANVVTAQLPFTV